MELSREGDLHQDLVDDLLQVLCQKTSDIAHDTSHILRVMQNVRRISDKEGGDLKVLTGATILHDCVHVPKDAPERGQASRRSADFAAVVLRERRWAPADISQVTHAIEAHSFSAAIPPRTLEARILQDADRLDALGHIGIARCFAVSGSLDRALYDPRDPKAERRPLDDRSYAVDHFSTKLLRLAEGFQTPTGRKMAVDRHAVIEQFLTGFMNEIAQV